MRCAPTQSCDWYGDPTEHIGEHTDSDPLFDTEQGPSVIVSVNLAMDGLFYGRLYTEKGLAMSAELAEHKTQVLNLLARYAYGDA